MQKLKLVTWNVGFGGMGSEAEIAMDGGKKLIPSSFSQIRKNMKGIQETVESHPADIFLLQEISHGSILNYWHNLESRVQNALSEFSSKFVSNFKFPFFLRILRNEHGLSTFVHNEHEVTRTQSVPYKKSEAYYRIFHRKDYFLATHVTPENGEPIVVINTHLSSFDKGGIIRKSQCREIINFANKLHKDGNKVIIGADWNMHLRGESILNRYETKFPEEYLLEGWTINYCEQTPTVRSTNKPYDKQTSTTATIDGFICSPGVSVNSVQALDFEFKHSDHNPVEITIEY